jgi:hypothetical protein
MTFTNVRDLSGRTRVDAILTRPAMITPRGSGIDPAEPVNVVHKRRSRMADT